MHHVKRPSLPDFAYARGYQSGITHYLRSGGVFWSEVSPRTHPRVNPDKRDTEGDIVVLNDGSLLLAWSDFHTDDWHDDAPCRISMRRSADGGRSWTPAEALQEAGNPSDNVMSVSLLRTGKGTVLFTWYSKNTHQHYVRRSTDDGRTFAGPLPNAVRPDRVANNDRFLELRDPQGKYGDRGRIILACRDYPARQGVMVWSDDDGLTWHAGRNVPVVPEWGPQNFNEPGIVELNDGRFWMYGRTTMGFHAQSWSEDRGMTWSRPEPMALRGPCSPQTGEMVPETPYTRKMGWAGDILFTFPNHDFSSFPREYSYATRTPLDAAISRDGAETWDHVRTIEEDPGMQYGYTSITFLDDRGTGMRVLLTTHVQPVPNNGHSPHDLKFISIPLEWFYQEVEDPQQGIDFADEQHHELWCKPGE